MPKKWYRSRILWANLSALVASVGLYFETGDPAVIFPGLLALFNIFLRLVTKVPLEK